MRRRRPYADVTVLCARVEEPAPQLEELACQVAQCWTCGALVWLTPACRDLVEGGAQVSCVLCIEPDRWTGLMRAILEE